MGRYVHLRPGCSAQRAHPLSGECLGESDAVAAGLADVGVVQEPVDGGGGQGPGHQFAEPGRVQVRAERDRPLLVGVVDEPVEPFGGVRADLVIVDDIGLLPVAHDAAEGLYRLVDAAYEKRSVAISSNLHPAGFDELMPKTLATATVDRLLHHAHVCQTSGDSVRLTQALAGRGVTPLH